jgi:type II secretory pathway pseudopilin PulG
LGTPQKKKSKSPIVLIALIGACVLSVPCIGIVAAVAIPSFVGYVRKSKVAEATSNVRYLETCVVDYCQRTGRLPGATATIPAFPGPEKQVADFSSDPVFAEIGFTTVDPIYYSYALRPELDGTLSILAQGDLDGDGQLSRFASSCDASCSCRTLPPEDELE